MTNLEKYYDSISALTNEVTFHDAVFMLRKNMTFDKFYKYKQEHLYVPQGKRDNLEWLSKPSYITSYEELKKLYKKDNNVFNGMFGENEYGEVFVIVGDKLVYQNGGYDMLKFMLDEECILRLLLRENVSSFGSYDCNSFDKKYYFFNKEGE